MSAAVVADAPPKKTKKKLIIILAAILLIVLAAGGTAVYIMKKKAAEALAQDGGDDTPAHKASRPRVAPVFTPLDPFVVNLADKETDRFAQVGVTLEIDDAKFAEEMKTYMPAIRNAILMILTSKTSTELVGRAGKEALASEIMNAVARTMGIDVADTAAVAGQEDPEHDAESDSVDVDAADTKPTTKPGGGTHNPIQRVHFSSFIIQ